MIKPDLVGHWPFSFEIRSETPSTLKEVNEWCHATCVGRYWVRPRFIDAIPGGINEVRIAINLHDDSDAVHFKLRWMPI